MPYPQFDRSQLRLLPLHERIHDLQRDKVLTWPDSPRTPFEHPAIPTLAEAIVKARKENRSVVFICGAHVLRQGNAPLLIDLMRRGVLTHLALNGAGAIHDYELALIGQTCESVAKYVSEGQFGLWQETGQINEIVAEGAAEGLGFGEAVGRAISQRQLPYRETLSLIHI